MVLCKSFGRKWAACVGLMSALACLSYGQQDKPLDKKDTRVEPTSWGNVVGRVYDAVTGAPIVGAEVSGYTDDGFLDKGRSVGKTENLGKYKVQLILGRISSNFDVGRALLSSPVGMLFGSATNTTKRLDVSRVALKVTASGYKPFSGVVTARIVDAGKFEIGMQPILLMPDKSEGQSVAAAGWSAIRFVRTDASPSLAEKGQTVRFSATLKLFTKEVAKTVEVRAFCDLWKGGRKLKREGEPNADGEVAFTGEYKVSGKEKQSANPVYFAIAKADVDFDTDKAVQATLIQIGRNEEDKACAGQRTNVLASIEGERFNEAFDAIAPLAKAANAQLFDIQVFTNLARRQGKDAEAVEPLSRLWQSDPKQLDVLERYAEALNSTKKDDELDATVSQVIKGVKPKDLGKKVTPATLAYLGFAKLRKADIEGAAKVNENLLEVPLSGISQQVIEFRGALRLAEVERDHKADPTSPSALADYGRALLDLGRIEEATTKLADAAKADPARVDIQKDLAWAALQMRGGAEKPPTDLAKAVEGAKAALNLEKGKQKSKDFSAWNQYAILLFALANEQQKAGSAEADATFDLSISALREALSLGRVGAKRNPGCFAGFQHGYVSGSEVAISGFAYPQANSSFLMLESLKRLRKSPTDLIGLFNASSALFDLGQNELAKAYLAKFEALAPDDPEGKFLHSLIAHADDNDDAAVEFLRAVLAAAPNHPRANLVLADLMVESGDVPSSSACLAAYAKYYGDTRKRM
jgi:tetratricopeptide (TPR) repeat protein